MASEISKVIDAKARFEERKKVALQEKDPETVKRRQAEEELEYIIGDYLSIINRPDRENQTSADMDTLETLKGMFDAIMPYAEGGREFSILTRYDLAEYYENVTRRVSDSLDAILRKDVTTITKGIGRGLVGFKEPAKKAIECYKEIVDIAAEGEIDDMSIHSMGYNAMLKAVKFGGRFLEWGHEGSVMYLNETLENVDNLRHVHDNISIYALASIKDKRLDALKKELTLAYKTVLRNMLSCDARQDDKPL